MRCHSIYRTEETMSSDLQPASKLTISWSFSTDLVRSKSLDVKGKESNSLFEIATASCTFLITSLMRFNF